MAFSEKNIPTRNDMLQAMPMNNGFMVEPPAIILDEDGNNMNENYNNVTRDFSVLGAGVNTANIQVKMNAKHEQAELKKKKKQDQDNLDRESSIAKAEMQNMIRMGDFDISQEDLHEINKKFKDDVDGKSDAELQATADAQGISVDWLLLRSNMANDVETNGWDETDMRRKYGDEKVDRYTDDVKSYQAINNKNKVENTSTATAIDLKAVETFLLDTAGSSDLSIKKPESQIASTFTNEVNNVGVNAKSFSLDEDPQVIVAERDPATFSLDTLS